jgi:hypothetical protein
MLWFGLLALLLITALAAHVAYLRIRERRGANPKRWLPGPI